MQVEQRNKNLKQIRTKEPNRRTHERLQEHGRTEPAEGDIPTARCPGARLGPPEQKVQSKRTGKKQVEQKP